LRRQFIARKVLPEPRLRCRGKAGEAKMKMKAKVKDLTTQRAKNPKVMVAVALVYFCLTLAGVTGLAYKIFNPEGWLSQALGYAWDIQLHFSLIALPVMIVAVYLGLKLFKGFWYTKSGTFGNWLTVACMALGGYFIVRLIFWGSI
jgi:hypothetical protein